VKLSFILAIIAFGNLQPILIARPSDPAATLPSSIDGWTATPVERWNRETLYQYIDGGAELYLAYSFEEAACRRYARSGQPDITVDIFEMKEAGDAFGVFSMSRERDDGGFGQGAQIGPGLIVFWKDRYCVSILSWPETPDSRAVSLRLASIIDSAIGREALLPALLSRLPSAGMRPATQRYFHHHALQTVDGFPVNRNILRLSEKTEVAGARYSTEKGDASLFIVRYPDERIAQQALNDWLSACESDSSAATGGCGGARKKDTCFIVYGATSKEAANALLEAAMKKKI
jgi:hypothetical protein